MSEIISMIPNREFKLSELSKVNSSASEIDGKVIPIDTIALLRAKTVTPSTVWVSGYHIKGDGAFGSNIFEWDSTSVEDDNGGTIIKLTSVTTGRYKLKFGGAVNVKWFGAKGDDNGLGSGTDSTIAINSACTHCLSSGESLEFPAGNYKVTDTITLENEEFVKAFSLYGQNGSSTNIYFYNSTPLKDFFFVDTNVNYLHIRDIQFVDTNKRTSRGFYFRDITPDPDGGSPSWKHKFENVRINGFKEGVRFDGDTANLLRDAHCSEVMFIHSKLRNCETSLIYNNTQAVNHQLIGLDIENDQESGSDEWICIKFERGSTVNHIGGSVIGKGSYIEYKYSEAGGFQDTAQFSANGVRIEKRGGVSPVINHNTNSTITISNSFRIILENIPIITTTNYSVFGRFGGRTFVKFTNVHANKPMVVEAYITSKLAANGEFGSISIIDCDKISYERIWNVAAYGGTAIPSTNYRAIPASINYKNEGSQISIDGNGYQNIAKPSQNIYSGGWEVSQQKTMVYSSKDSAGLGSGANTYTESINIPLHARPFKFTILRDYVNADKNFVLDLYIVISEVDHLVASITPTPNSAGYFESNIQTTIGIPLVNFINNGVIWDGKMKIVKSGTTSGFVGLIMIDYM